VRPMTKAQQRRRSAVAERGAVAARQHGGHPPTLLL
jgi:hypothetical protein